MNIYQQRRPEKHENLLMTLSDALLQALQQWFSSRRVSQASKCHLTLHTVELLAAPKCLIALLGIPVYAFYRSSIQDTRQIQAMMDTLSFHLLIARLQNLKKRLKLVITVY